MGKVYPTYKWGVEGDTPSFLHVMPNGLNDPNDPTQVGWGGYHVFGLSPDSITYAWTNWQQPMYNISNRYEKKFYPDEFSDFAARMEWADKGKGNVNPEIVINGKAGFAPITIHAKAGVKLVLDGRKTCDRDGDSLTFDWWQQLEAGSYQNSVSILGGNTSRAEVTIPESAHGKAIHVVCEVHDDGPFHLVAYRRVIICVD